MINLNEMNRTTKGKRSLPPPDTGGGVVLNILVL